MINWKRCGRKRYWYNSRYYPDICLEILRKTTKTISQDSRSPGRDLGDFPNTKQTTRPRCSVIKQGKPWFYLIICQQKLQNILVSLYFYDLYSFYSQITANPPFINSYFLTIRFQTSVYTGTFLLYSNFPIRSPSSASDLGRLCILV
jgi:hypothetical protein